MAETSDSKRGMRLRIDPHRCIGNAMCTRAAPGSYGLDEETRIAEILDDDATIQQLFAGARACPTQAIIIEQYGQRMYPQILTPMFGDRDDDAQDSQDS